MESLQKANNPGHRRTRTSNTASGMYAIELALMGVFKKDYSKLDFNPDRERDPAEPSDKFEESLQGVRSTNYDIVQQAMQVPMSFDDHAFGCIIGAFLGNALGSVYENSRQRFEDVKLPPAQCMDIALKEITEIATGQVTADGEVAMCSMWSILRANEQDCDIAKIDPEFKHIETKWVEAGKAVPQTLISQEWHANYYSRWAKTKPFQFQDRLKIPDEVAPAKSIMQDSILTRSIPIAIWTSGLANKNDLIKALMTDMELTHSDPNIHQATYIYCNAIQYLLAHRTEPMRCQLAWQKSLELSAAPINGYKTQDLFRLGEWISMSGELQYRFENMNKRTTSVHIEPRCQKDTFNKNFRQRGDTSFVKCQFILSMYYLQRCAKMIKDKKLPGDIYATVVNEIITKAGDSDGIAAAPIALVGAAFGLGELPPKQVQQVVNFDATNKRIYGMRPDWLNPKKHLLNCIRQLIDNRPISESKTTEFFEMKLIEDEKKSQEHEGEMDEITDDSPSS